ncbi:MAG: restriction endonuclease subunit S [Sulfuricellaceae bacterium]
MPSSVNKRGLAPVLRFPEFMDAGEWKGELFGKVYSFKTTNSLSRDKLNYKQGTVKNIHYGDIHTKFSTLFDIEKENVPYINPTESVEKIRPDSYCIESDMIFADASEDTDDIGKCIEIVSLNNEKLVSGLHTLLARQIEKKLVTGFGGYLFKSNRIREQIKKESQGAKVLGLSGGRLSSISVVYPADEKEQKKIADCLTSIDEFITAQTQKLDALKTHKKGLMQQLFPAEGETLPKRRFPEFRDKGEWEALPIGEKIDLLSGHPFDGADISEDVSGIPLMRGINITEGFVRHSRDMDRFFLGDVKKLEKYRLRIDDLVIGMDGSKVGKNSALISEIDADTLLVQRVARLRAKGEATIHFIFQQINSSKFHAYVDRINTSSGIPHISAKQINDFKICFPSVAEQQKIADCLASLDDLITAQTKKLAALKTHKKGLMQQLFPAMDEVDA